MIFNRKRLKRAKFRGRPFYLSTSDVETGRRIPSYLPPFEDEAVIIQDLGKREQVIYVNGFVCGANYRLDAEHLLAACEEPGPGILSHPYLGDKTVICKNVRMTENSVEGGVVYFSFCFAETLFKEEIGFGLGSIPLLGTLLGRQCLKDATKQMNDAIDLVDQVPAQMDNFVDSVLAGAENLEKISGPVIHAADAMNNIALALNDLRATADQIYARGVLGLAHSYNHLRGVIAGHDLGDVDPYNWTKMFPKERFNYPTEVEAKIFFSDQLFLIGIHTASIAPKVAEKGPTKEQAKSLEVLKRNVDEMLAKAPAESYATLKPVQAFCIDKLFYTMPEEQENERPTQCLILEAFKRGVKPETIKDEYRSTHPCFPK